MRNRDVLKLASMVKRAGNDIFVPEEAPKARPRVAQPPVNQYLTGEAFPATQGLGAAAGRTATSPFRMALAPITGLFSAGAKGPGRVSGLGGAAGSLADIPGALIAGNTEAAGTAGRQFLKDINPWNSQGAWSQSIQRHMGRAYEDASRSIPTWFRAPGGFFSDWGQSSVQNIRGRGAGGGKL